MTRLIREYRDDGEFLSGHHPDEPDGRDDARDATVLGGMTRDDGSFEIGG
jgi:hypothetical protein